MPLGAALELAQQSLDQEPGVARVRVNPACRSLVVNFDFQEITLERIVALARETAGVASPPQATCRSDQSCAVCRRSPEREHPLRGPLRRFLGLTAVGALALWRTRVLGLTVGQGLFSPLGLVVAVASLPMLREGWRRGKEGKLSLEGFLGGSIVLAAAMGQALTALEILWIDSGAGLLKAWISERSRRAISDILAVTSQSTYILVDGLEVQVPVDQVQVGDIVVLHTGEKIAVDGRVEQGEALVDESPINGRAEFVLRGQGDEVFAGTLVREGVIYVNAQKVGDETYLARVLALVEDSLQNKAPIQGVADDLARKLIKLGGRGHPGHPHHHPQLLAGLHRAVGDGLPLRHGAGRLHRHQRGHQRGGQAPHPHQGRPLSGRGGQAGHRLL